MDFGHNGFAAENTTGHMNIKSERIEQLIQVVNRNLQLIFAGQSDGITMLDRQQLQKVDTVIFGHDKFAFEMVHFVKSAMEKNYDANSLSNQWERAFVLGLEALLIECAVVNDDIERDCFVSRVYCWFSEKLMERRELPRSVNKLGGSHIHTIRALESYNKDSIANSNNQQVWDILLFAMMISWQKVDFENTADRDFPVISVPEGRGLLKKKLPLYVKNGFPAIMQTGLVTGESSFNPIVPGPDENYGLLYNKPETEAEKTMHELWMAKRRQEAFEWKTQHHLGLVMDRLALHKSRLESESLRRQESGAMLKQNKLRPMSANEAMAARQGLGSSRMGQRPATDKGGIRRAPKTPTNASSMPQMSPLYKRLNQSRISNADDASAASDVSTAAGSAKAPPGASGYGERAKAEPETTVTIVGQGMESEANIAKPGRSTIRKPSQSNMKKDLLPMRFKIDLPEDYANDRSQFYMQISDSDEEPDDKPANTQRLKTTTSSAAAGKTTKKKPAVAAAAGKVEVAFRREKPVIRERPQSAKLFKNVAANDPEFKVLYRHTNFRRMPMTERQEQWLKDREAERTKKDEEFIQQLLAEAAAKNDKKGGKDKDKGGKGGDKGGGKEKDKGKKGGKTATSTVTEVMSPVKSSKSAAQILEEKFPNFEGQDNMDAIGPMRTTQLVEVARVMNAFQERDLGIKENVLRRALLIPQDRPESICLQNLKEVGEGLMVNPLPPEYWRKTTFGGKKGKKGKKKGKK